MTTTRFVLDFIKPPSMGRMMLGALVLILAALVLIPSVSAALIPLTGINAIQGTTQIGNVLTNGTVIPSAATVTFQWLHCTSSSNQNTCSVIGGATSNTYIPVLADYNLYMRVNATGTGSYTGTVTSASKGPVTKIPLTDIADPTGVTHLGNTLTAGALTPPAATVTYQWYSCTWFTWGTCSPIGGATSSTYLLQTGEVGRYMRVEATGTGSYTGTQHSDYVGPVQAPLTAIGAPTGTLQYNSQLTAGTVTPPGADFTYQWLRCLSPDLSSCSVASGDHQHYTLQVSDVGKYIVVNATGTDNYYGTVNSTAVGPIMPIPLTAIGATTGTVQVDHTLTAGALTPPGATVTYQWQNASILGGPFSDISGATSHTYALGPDDVAKYYRVNATGTGGYSGTVSSTVSGPVAPAPITAIGATTGTVQVDHTLTAGALTPSGATVTYQWQNATSAVGPYTPISGATSNTYPLGADDYGRYYQVVATGTGAYYGIVTSTAVGPVAPAPITAVGPTTGTVEAYYTLTAGGVTPPDATVTYQWQNASTENGPYTPISGATFSTYDLSLDDFGLYYEVVVTGTGSYFGAINSTAVGPIYMPPPEITSISPPSGQQAIGTAVTIIGTNFTGADHVYFDATEVSFTPVDNFHITTTSPAPGTGVVDVTVHTPTGTSPTSPADHFKYGVEKEVGIYKDGVWYLDYNKNGTWDGATDDRNYNFGGPGNVSVVGDWNGDGITEIGVTDGINWYLDANGNGVWDGTGPGNDQYGFFGIPPSYTPIVGDWNDDGITEIGVTNGIDWYLDTNGNGVWDGTGPGNDQYGFFGIPPTYISIVGDWNGDGKDKIGVTNGTDWYLDTNGNGVWDGTGPGGDQHDYFSMGPGYTPIVGDWNGDSRTKIGLTDGINWYLDANGNGVWDGTGPGGDQYGFFGIPPSYIPIVGDWSGDGRDQIGVTNDVQWYLDANGNGVWDGTPTDKAPFFGITGWTPVIGKWQ